MSWTDSVSWLFIILVAQAFVVLIYDCVTGVISYHKNYLRSGKNSELKRLRNSYFFLSISFVVVMAAVALLVVNLIGKGW